MTRSDCKHVCMLARVPSYPEIPPTVSSRPCQTLCQLRRLTLPCAWHHGTLQFLRSRKRLQDERERVTGFVCHPYSTCTFFWECLHLMVTFAAYLYIPFQVFMYCPNPYDPFILFNDLMMFINILLSFATGYVNEETKLIVLEGKLIARHYLRTNFFPDLIASLPLQTIHIFGNCRYPSSTILLILKLFSLPTSCKEATNLQDQLGLSYVKKKVTTIVITVILFVHWMTYIHYQVPCFSIHYLDEKKIYKVWLKRFIVTNIDTSSIFQKYIANLFLVCGLCIGAGYYSAVDEHLISELLLTAIMGLVGLVFLTYAFSSLLQLALCRQYEENLFNGRAMELKGYMNFKRLPKSLQRKIQLFINYKFNGHYFNEEMIMNTVNEQIKQDINMYGCKKLVMSVPLFQDMPIALINSIIFSLTQFLYMPGEFLVKYGMPGKSLYMISSGTVAVMSSGGREIAHLRDGSYFGETALLHPGTLRCASIIALEITEVYKLDNKSFLSCLVPYSHLMRRLEENYFKRRLTGSIRSDQYHPPSYHSIADQTRGGDVKI